MVGLLVIEAPWWIGSRNLTDSDKRLFGVACSIKQHQPPPPLPPSFAPLPPSLFSLQFTLFWFTLLPWIRLAGAVTRRRRLSGRLSDHLTRVASSGGLFGTSSVPLYGFTDPVFRKGPL